MESNHWRHAALACWLVCAAACTPPPVVDAGAGDGGSLDAGTPVVLGDVVDVSAGSEHTCAVRTDGSVWCWGRNDMGQLGDGTTTDQGKPVQVLGVDGATTVSAGFTHSCAVLTDGGVMCWGSNSHAQLGSEVLTDTFALVDIGDVIRVVATGRRSCAITVDGLVFCWGDSRFGQIGIGGSSAVAEPTVVPGIHNASAIDGRCFVHDLGRVSCWNSVGSLSEIPGIANAVDVAFPYAALDDGSLVFFAYGSVERRANILTGGPARAVRASWLEVCVERDDDTLHCFANDEAYFLTSEDAAFEVAPWPVESSHRIRTFSLGNAHACALRSTQELACWGSNARGQLGKGITGISDGAIDVEGIEGATAIAVGNQHACAIHDGGRIACWGFNHHASLGDGTRQHSERPVDVVGIDDAAAIAAGIGQVCAVRANGSLWCWGSIDPHAESPLGSWPPSSVPAVVVGTLDIVHISTSKYATCVQEALGSVACYGRLALSSVERIESLELSPVGAFFGTRDVSVVHGSTLCALRDDVDKTRVQCMGTDSTLNENAFLTPDDTPFDVEIDGVVALDAGYGHICALSDDGHVSCWGLNTSGEVSPQAELAQTSPIEVPGVDGTTEISAGMRQTCARREDGHVLCWGAGLWAGSENGFNFEAGVHVVENLDDAVAVSSGVMLACAVRANGRVACWGNGQFGGLGVSAGSSFRDSVVVTFPDE